jgi:hypothetical protein
MIRSMTTILFIENAYCFRMIHPMHEGIVSLLRRLQVESSAIRSVKSTQTPVASASIAPEMVESARCREVIPITSPKPRIRDTVKMTARPDTSST